MLQRTIDMETSPCNPLTIHSTVKYKNKYIHKINAIIAMIWNNCIKKKNKHMVYNPN